MIDGEQLVTGLGLCRNLAARSGCAGKEPTDVCCRMKITVQSKQITDCCEGGGVLLEQPLHSSQPGRFPVLAQGALWRRGVVGGS